eukprot:4506217-Amphidinium_carterae.1
MPGVIASKVHEIIDIVTDITSGGIIFITVPDMVRFRNLGPNVCQTHTLPTVPRPNATTRTCFFVCSRKENLE